MSDNGWDPSTHQDPVRALTQRIRGLSVGQSLRLTNGTVIKSVPIRRGGTHVRRFMVSKSRKSKSRGVPHETAADAAKVALGKGAK